MLRQRSVDWQGAWSHAKDQFLVVFASECVFWIPFQALSFHYVPSLYRVVVYNAGCVVWACILSFIEHREGSQSSLHSEDMPVKDASKVPGPCPSLVAAEIITAGQVGLAR